MAGVSKLKPTKFDGIVELVSSRMAVTFTGVLPKLSEKAYSREVKIKNTVNIRKNFLTEVSSMSLVPTKGDRIEDEISVPTIPGFRVLVGPGSPRRAAWAAVNRITRAQPAVELAG